MFYRSESDLFLEKIYDYFSTITAVVGSGPDFSKRLISSAESILFVNGALEYSKNLGKKIVWLATDTMLSAASNPPQEVRVRAIAGAKANLVISSHNMSRSEVAIRLNQIGVEADEIITMPRSVLFQLLVSIRPRHWIVDVVKDPEVVRDLLTSDGLYKFMQVLPVLLGSKKISIPLAWRPSGGVIGALLVGLTPKVTEVLLTGIALGSPRYIFEGRLIQETLKRGHMPVDELLLRTLVRSSGAVWASSDGETALRTGMDHKP